MKQKIIFYFLSTALFFSAGSFTSKPKNNLPKVYAEKSFQDEMYKAWVYEISGRVQCALFDLGGKGVGYLDNDSINNGSEPYNHKFVSKPDFRISPFTGYTRAHWLAITEKIIAGALPYLDTQTGMPDLPWSVGDEAYEKFRSKTPETPKRALERIMMAVVIYTKATGKDEVPGHKGSISAPFIKAIIKGTDPTDTGYWGDPLPNDHVGSVFAMAAYIEPSRYWDPLTPKQKANMLEYFRKMAFLKTHNNNHYYFHMVPATLLDQNSVPSNREHLTKMYERLMGWYRGNGWFLDGNNRGFDYYNLWGFQLFNQVLYKYDPVWRAQFGERIKITTARFLETFPYLFGRDGGPIPWGRSLSYRFASNSAIAWAVINGLSSLPPGQARRIASGNLKYFWEHDCLGENNLLTLGYWGANAAVAENYLYYGDPYWATHGLACLLIPENDPFWTSLEEPMPADGAGGKIAVPGAQFSIRVSSVDGESRLFPVGQTWGQGREKWQTSAKYDQYAYSGYLGFCVLGEGGEELGAGRTGYSYDGKKWFYRERAKPIQVETDYLISRYTLKPSSEKESTPEENRDEMITHTLVGNDGEVHIFWHNYPDPLYLHMGGYGISVPHGTDLDKKNTNLKIQIKGGEMYSILQPVKTPEGKLDAILLDPREGWNHTHLFGGRGAFPYWQSIAPVGPNVPVVFYVNGTKGRNPVVDDIQVQSLSGILKIKFEGKWHVIIVPNMN